MEQVERVDVAVDRGERAFEKYGWMILSASALLGIVAAVVTTFPPLYVFSSSLYEGVYPMLGALGTALVGFNILALVMSMIPYRRGERWAWFTMWILPLGWVSQFFLLLDASFLVLAVLTTVGLVLPYRKFFPGREKDAPRVS